MRWFDSSPASSQLTFVRLRKLRTYKCHILQCYKKPTKKVAAFRSYRVGDYLGEEGKPTRSIKEAAAWKDADCLEDVYEWGVMSEYFKSIEMELVKKKKSKKS